MNIDKELALERGQEEKTLFLGHPSVLNGPKDYTTLGGVLEQHRETIIKHLKEVFGSDAETVYKLALAEHLYQQDQCFEALIQVVSTIPMMEKKKNIWCLFVALTLEMTILVMSGQASSTVPLMKALRERVLAAGGGEALLENIDALEVWAAMYDGSAESINHWMQQGAPDEYGEFDLVDTYRFLIKLRGYLVQEKHIALFALAERLKSELSAEKRVMDCCEVTLLMALSCHAQGRLEQAYRYMDEVLKIAEENRYDRLIGDEGKRMYRLLYDYRRERGRTPYLERVMEIAKKAGLLYPDYLKGLYHEVQQLSDSELKVLRLMEEQLSSTEMAEYLDISVNTIKFHSKNIFRKLNVHNRNMAVKRARELGML